MRSPLSTRPLPWLAAVFALGTYGGILAAEGERVIVIPAVLLPAGFLLLHRRDGLALAILGLLAFARGWMASPPVPEVELGPGSIAGARDVPVVGRWHCEGRPGTGFVEPVGVPAAEGHRILYETAALVPREGDWVAILPGRAPTPWPRGPIAGPRARERRFLGSSFVHPDEWVHLPAARLGVRLRERAERWIEDLRARIRARTEALESPLRARGLVRSLVLGERDELTGEVRDLFTRTGTAHLLAVSGFNVSLLFGAFGFLALLPAPGRRTGRGRLVGAWITASLLFAYAWIVGWSAPVLRASTSLALATFAPVIPSTRGPFTPRRADALSLWSAALIVECLISPRDLSQVSLLLSYLATLGILLCTRPLQQLLDRGRFLADSPPGSSPTSLALRIIARRGVRIASLSLAASMAATLFTLPVVWSHFGEAAPAGVIVTPVVAPFFALLLLLSWFGVFLPSLGLGPLLGFLSERFCDVLALADELPGTPTPLPLRPIFLVTLAVVLATMGLARREPHTGRAAALVGGLLLVPWSLAPQGLELHGLEVGHGSAFLVRAPGLPALVFDAGSRNRRGIYEEAVAPLLAQWETSRPWIVLSHEDSDHLSALPRMVERYPPSVWVGALPAHLAARLPHDVRLVDTGGGTVTIASPGSPAPIGLRVLRANGEPGNEGSRNLEIAWGADRLVLFGDCEAEGMERLLREGWISGPLRLLALAHHGSQTPLLGDLLDATRPKETWISNSELPPTTRELDRRGLSWACTGERGPLALLLPWPAPRQEPARPALGPVR